MYVLSADKHWVPMFSALPALQRTTSAAVKRPVVLVTVDIITTLPWFIAQHGAAICTPAVSAAPSQAALTALTQGLPLSSPAGAARTPAGAAVAQLPLPILHRSARVQAARGWLVATDPKKGTSVAPPEERLVVHKDVVASESRLRDELAGLDIDDGHLSAGDFLSGCCTLVPGHFPNATPFVTHGCAHSGQRERGTLPVSSPIEAPAGGSFTTGPFPSLSTPSHTTATATAAMGGKMPDSSPLTEPFAFVTFDSCPTESGRSLLMLKPFSDKVSQVSQRETVFSFLPDSTLSGMGSPTIPTALCPSPNDAEDVVCVPALKPDDAPLALATTEM